MIALYMNWTSQEINPEIEHKIVSSLGVGHKSVNHSVVMHNAMVAITKAKPGWRPTRTDRGEFVIFDGYIDNKSYLREQLGCDKYEDAELYAAAYMAWANETDIHVVGQYAAIIFHPLELYVRITRSPISAPPLHIRNDHNRIIIASTPRVIFATDEVTKEIDEQKIADALFLNFYEEERGWFKGIRRVPLGHVALANPNNINFIRFHDLFSLPQIRFTSDNEYVEAADALFQEATRAALHGFSRPAVSLSGGYDSQAVAAYALKELKGARLLGLTSVPEPSWDGRIYQSWFGDESRHVAALASMYPSLDTVSIDASGLFFDHKLDAMFLLTSAPPQNSFNLHWWHELMAYAKSKNCDVMLDGQMGNATFSFDGAGALAGWARSGNWNKIIGELYSARGNLLEMRHILSMTFGPLLPKYIWFYLRKLLNRELFDPYETWCPINPVYAKEMRVEERALEMMHDVSFQPPKSTNAVRTTMFCNMNSEMGDLTQSFELMYGIPSRDPTSYRPLVEFCLGIPDDQYLRFGQKRWLARRMLKGKIPDEVIEEKKRGLQSADWHMRMGRQIISLKNEVDQLMEDPDMMRRFDLPSLKKSLDAWPSETPLGFAQLWRLQLAVTRCLTTARFIRYVEGKNK